MTVTALWQPASKCIRLTTTTTTTTTHSTAAQYIGSIPMERSMRDLDFETRTEVWPCSCDPISLHRTAAHAHARKHLCLALSSVSIFPAAASDSLRTRCLPIR
jgi:hypothetical protein